MKEITYLAPNANGSELLKSLALQGRNSFNLKIVSAVELSRLALMRCAIPISEDFLSSKEETALISEAVKEIIKVSGNKCYIDNPTYSDIKEISRAIRTIRSLVSCENSTEDKAPAADFNNEDVFIEARLLSSEVIFREKNEFLLSVYRKYKEILAERNLIDSVSLIRKAIENCTSLNAEIEFHTLKEYPLAPLEKTLIETLSLKKVKDIESDLLSLFKVPQAPLHINSFKNCYGAPNEVEMILTDIYKHRKLDECTVAVTGDSIYAQLFLDYALLYDIPVSFGCGVPIINSNPAKLLEQYRQWVAGGIFSPQALKNMLLGSVFNRDKLEELYPNKPDKNICKNLEDILEGLRLTNSPSENIKRIADFIKALDEEKEILANDRQSKDYIHHQNKEQCIPYLKVLANELALPVEDFINRYAYIRKKTETCSQRLLMSLDMVSLKTVCQEISLLRKSGVDKNSDDLYTNTLGLKVSLGKSESGHLLITSIDGALSALKKNLYIAGLSASIYPGSPKENYLLLDNDLSQFGDGAQYLKADNIITKKKDKLLYLLKLASSLNTDISISFAGLNVSELKHDNGSSLVLKLLRDNYGENLSVKELEENITKIKYFEPAISVSRAIGQAYSEGRTIESEDSTSKSNHNTKEDKINLNKALDKEYSPTALEIFFTCKKRFMFNKILNLPEVNDEKNFEVIAANEAGTLAHSLMEKLANTEMTEDEFLKLSEQYFDRFMLSHPALIPEHVNAEKEQFLEMMKTAYDMDGDNHREVVLKEEDIHHTHSTGVKLHGYPDRVEKLEDGTYMVVDYKTARKVSHVKNDINSCLQIVIYAYLLSKKGYKVSKGEYRYIRLNEKVECSYNNEMESALDEKLKEFKEHLENADFPDIVTETQELGLSATEDNCKYCKFSLICTKNQGELNDE